MTSKNYLMEGHPFYFGNDAAEQLFTIEKNKTGIYINTYPKGIFLATITFINDNRFEYLVCLPHGDKRGIVHFTALEPHLLQPSASY